MSKSAVYAKDNKFSHKQDKQSSQEMKNKKEGIRKQEPLTRVLSKIVKETSWNILLVHQHPEISFSEILKKAAL